MNGLRTSNGTSHSQKSQDIISSLVSLVNGLGTDFQKELAQKTEAIARTQGTLQTATKDLTEHRKQLAGYKAQVLEQDQQLQKIKNLETALQEEAIDWTGRMNVDPTAPIEPAFDYRYAGMFDIGPYGSEPPRDLAVPGGSDGGTLVQLRRMLAWHQRILLLVRQRMDQVKGSSTQLEAHYRKLLASFSGIQEDQVDGMLGQLMQAVQSDGSQLVSILCLASSCAHAMRQELSRVSNFLSKVKS
jgi:regulatory protein SWI6